LTNLVLNIIALSPSDKTMTTFFLDVSGVLLKLHFLTFIITSNPVNAGVADIEKYKTKKIEKVNMIILNRRIIKL
jgi:hypothetical protein